MKYIYCIIFGIIFYLLSNNINGFSISNQIFIDEKEFEKYIQVYNEDKCILDDNPANSTTIDKITKKFGGPCLYCTVRKYLKLLDIDFVINNEQILVKAFEDVVNIKQLINYFRNTITPYLIEKKLISEDSIFKYTTYSNLQIIIETITRNNLLFNVMLVSVNVKDKTGGHIFMIYITKTEIIIIEGLDCGVTRFKYNDKYEVDETFVLNRYKITIENRLNYNVYGYMLEGEFISIKQSEGSIKYLNELITKHISTFGGGSGASCTVQ